MSTILLIFRPIVIFTLIASFSLVFMQLFLIAGILSAKIKRNVDDETDEAKNLKGYTMAALGGLIAGSISLVAMTFL